MREEVFLPTTGPGVTARPPRGGDLGRKLADVEAKLRAKEQEHAGDAELIGNLLGELADRDRRIKALEQRAHDDEARRVELETELAMVESRTHAGTDRTIELENALRRSDRVFAELLRRLSEVHGGEIDVSRLHDLLAVTMSTLDVGRTFVGENAQKLDETRAAMGNVGAHAAERGLEATLARANAVLDASAPVDKEIGHVVASLRDIERRERELDELRAILLADASELVLAVQGLRDAMGNLARRPGSTPRHRQAPPPKPPPPRAR